MASLQTQDCVLLWFEDVELWSNSVDCCRSNFYNLHTSVDGTRHWCGHGNDMGCWPPTKLPPPAAVIFIDDLNREDVSGQSTDQTMLRCVMFMVMQWRPVTDWPSIGVFEAASSDHPCDNYRPVNLVWAVKQCTRETCVDAQYLPISGRRDNRKVADYMIDIVISPKRGF